MISFVGRTPTYYTAKSKSSVQTPTFGAEFIALKKAVEKAITLIYYLRSMGVKIAKLSIIYGDNLSIFQIPVLDKKRFVLPKIQKNPASRKIKGWANSPANLMICI